MRKDPTTAKTKKPKREPVVVPIIGTVDDEGVHLRESTPEEARKEAGAVAAFLKATTPDFLTEVVLLTLDDAFEHFGMLRPVDKEGELADYDEENLWPLFVHTKLTSWDDLWPDKRRLATAVSDILSSEETPKELHDAVASFVLKVAADRAGFAEGGFWTEKMLERLLVWHEEKTKTKEEVDNAPK